MSFLAELAAEGALRLLFWVVILAVLWLVSTPVILMAALFQADAYWTSVCQMYTAVTEFWTDVGCAIL